MKALTQLEAVIKNNTLEENIQDESELIRCFVLSNYSYFNTKDIQMTIITDFYKFYSKLDSLKRGIVIDNLVSRLSTIIVDADDELPF